MDWKTYMSFPVAYKKWLIKRIETEINKAHETKNDIPSKGFHHNSPDARAITGKTRHQVPSKLQRFT